jgi:hypothetical protein
VLQLVDLCQELASDVDSMIFDVLLQLVSLELQRIYFILTFLEFLPQLSILLLEVSLFIYFFDHLLQLLINHIVQAFHQCVVFGSHDLLDDSFTFFHLLGDCIAYSVGDEAMGTCILRCKTFTHWSQLAGDASTLEDGHSPSVGQESAFASRQ